ncbi:MAG: single-stranded-DNA-specific exonuclease RecJ, partial [Candidatus Aminicenantes bacterium]|nr:single-stranded-DNA-specific exonuclease RecJ [Candidatus Aminicenantes bacterium]
YIKIVLEKKAGLVISVDCGIKALPFAKRAREEGIDVIITDHHIPGDSLPETSAILNPVLQNSGYPDKNLAGVGVVFKLIQALFAREEKSLSLPWYLKLVAIGTVADVGQLRGENRLLVKFGLKALEDVSDPGLSSLMEICQLKGRSVSAGDIGFRIGPRINAAGRMGKTDLAVKLFFTNSLPESIELVSHLDELNSRRRRKQEKIYKQALERIRKSSFDDRYRFLILGCEEWHRGVLGIVASKLKDFFHRPVLLFSYENGKAYGSGRTISEFPLIDCLHECKDWLLDYGGHSMAVGCVLERENMTFFRKAVNDFVRSRITDDHLKRKISIDSKIDFTDLTSSFIEKYSLLSPFGAGNPKPVFLTERAEVLGEPKEIKGRHSKLVVNQKGRIFEALGWNRNDWAQNFKRGDIIDLVYSIQFSEYMGEKKLNLSLEDIKN